jgi:hypothetical protein
MNIVHLTSSTAFGGPERQMLGLAHALPGRYRNAFLSFSEGGRCADFRAGSPSGLHGRAAHDTPHPFAATRGAGRQPRSRRACARATGGSAVARQRGARGVPVVRCPALDRRDAWFAATRLDGCSCGGWTVSCVFQGQARRCSGRVSPHKVLVIHNAICTGRFTPRRRRTPRLLGMFDARESRDRRRGSSESREGVCRAG